MPDGAANLGGGRWGYAVTGLRGGPNTAQKFLDFMQFFGKFDKIVCPQRVGVSSYREFWIRPCYVPNYLPKAVIGFEWCDLNGSVRGRVSSSR